MILLTALFRLIYGLLVVGLIALGPTQAMMKRSPSQAAKSARSALTGGPARTAQTVRAPVSYQKAERTVLVAPERVALEEEEEVEREERPADAPVVLRPLPESLGYSCARAERNGPAVVSIAPLESSDCTRGPPASSQAA